MTPVGGLSHAQWRHSGVPFATQEVEFCIDGDFVELFLEIGEAGKERVVEEINQSLGTQYTAKGISNYIQDVRMKHSFVSNRHKFSLD